MPRRYWRLPDSVRASFPSGAEPWHRCRHDRQRRPRRPSIRSTGWSSWAPHSQGCEQQKRSDSTTSPRRSWSSATRCIGPTTGRRCRRNCCPASGNPTGSTSVNPTCSTTSTSSGVSARSLGASTSPVANSRLADGSVLGFDGLVIATGAHPRRLSGQETFDHVHELRTLDDSLRLRERDRRRWTSCRRDRCRIHRARGGRHRQDTRQ